MPNELLTFLAIAAAALAGAWAGSAWGVRRTREADTRSSNAANRLMARVQELETERTLMTAMLSGMVEGVLIVDGDGRLRLVNDAARQMLNLEHDLLGRHYVETVRQPGVVQQVSAALRGEHRPPIEVPLDSPGGASGGSRIFRAQATPASAGGGAVLVLHDISDLRRVDRVRRDFVANVSHELRTPLTAVRGYIEALMDGDVDQGQQVKFLEVIDRQTGRMERLVRDLLKLARLDAHQETADIHVMGVSALFQSVWTDLSERIGARKVRLDVSIQPDAALIEADPAKMYDALRNLVENSVNYSSEGGLIELGARLEGDRVLLTVADSGPGLPEADLGRVFERFYRVEQSRGSDPGGTGLGLSIVRHLVELHGGRVRADNRPGGGALFTISLPFTDAKSG
jgi:two-component system, OmpR family, phosphate regulon sensor histidine kinase PhoR